MTRCAYLTSFSVLQILLCCVDGTRMCGADDRPNIVLILADDLGYGDLSCYNEQVPATPHCDQIANAGVLFTDAHSPSSVCTPTRYSVLTGRYAWRTWLKDWVHNERMPLLIEPGRATLPKLLQKAGYTTGCIGKWHLGWGRVMNSYQLGMRMPGPVDVGFDSSFVVPFSHNSSPSMEHFVRDRDIVGLRPGESIMNESVAERVRRSLPDTATDLSTEAVSFVRRHASDESPFFLYHPTTNVHFPITPHERFVTSEGVTKKQQAEAAFKGFVREFDWAVGEIVSALEDEGVLDNTLLIVTSDNGGALRFGSSNGLLRGTKAEIYEGGHRIPLLIQWPSRTPAGTRCERPVCLTDLMPTLAGLTGTRLSGDVEIDGVDVSSLMTQPRTANADETVPERSIVHHSIDGTFAIRRGRWKLIDGSGSGRSRFKISVRDLSPTPTIDPVTGAVDDWSYLPMKSSLGNKSGQLFDMEADLQERNNLWERHPEIVAELAAELSAIKSKEK